jgi:uncharacterized DUF497 family protein
MRFKFDSRKSRAVKRKQGINLKEAQETFDQAYLVDQRTTIHSSSAQSAGVADTYVQ